MSQERLSNEEFVQHLMSFSQYGAMTQIFVIEAIRFYAESVSRTPEPTEDSNEMINPKLWHRIATDITKAMKEQYETPLAN